MPRLVGAASREAIESAALRVALVSALAACSPVAPAPPDASLPPARPVPVDDCQQPDQGDPRIAIGQGQTDYIPLDVGATLQVEKGPQGGYHVWLAVRMTNLAQSGSRTFIEATVPHTGPALAAFEVVFTFTVDEGGFCKLYGLRYRIDSDDVPYRTLLGRELEVRVRVTDPSGRVGTARTMVVLSSDVI